MAERVGTEPAAPARLPSWSDSPHSPCAPDDQPRPAARVRLSVRVRILAAVLVTTALGMLGAGGASYVIARQHAYESVRSALAQENEEINTVVRLVDSGQAGRPVEGPGDVLYLAIKSSVPDPGGAGGHGRW